jgi:hypothetical protein
MNHKDFSDYDMEQDTNIYEDQYEEDYNYKGLKQHKSKMKDNAQQQKSKKPDWRTDRKREKKFKHEMLGIDD